MVLNGGLIPVGGLDNFGSGFLPASYQASIFRSSGSAVANIEPQEPSADLALNKRRLRRKLDRIAAENFAHADAVEAAIVNYELAYRMQAAVPELTDLSAETAATKRMYGYRIRICSDSNVCRGMPARPPAGRARRAIYRIDLSIRRSRPLGSA